MDSVEKQKVLEKLAQMGLCRFQMRLRASKEGDTYSKALSSEEKARK